MEKDKAVILYSGGLDSTVLLYDIVETYGAENVYALGVDYGQKHKRELEAAAEICRDIGATFTYINEPLLGEAHTALTDRGQDVPHAGFEDPVQKATIVPGRNIVFLALATAYAQQVGARYIYYAAHQGDAKIYPDCRLEFYMWMANAIAASTEKEEHITLIAPYLNIDKAAIVQRGATLKVPFSKTWSCYEGGSEPCGKCGACVERAEAFSKAGVTVISDLKTEDVKVEGKPKKKGKE